MMTYFDMSQLGRGAEAIGRMVQEHDERVAALERDLAAALARAEVLEVAFDNSHQLNEQLGNENRALLARAEAAEAERDEWKAAYADNELYCLAVMQRRDELAARVAELEAQLAAQQWRPVTITEPSLNVMAELIIVGYRGHDGYWHYPDGPEGLVIRGWRPVPPSVALREPTP